jgi:hypothetical protein
MQIDSEKLITVTNFAKQKGLARQHVYRLIDSGLINSIEIDSISFVVLDEKAENFQRQRKIKQRK